ncbi:MAG: hypothetical protein CVV25_14815 [Ignavibacteriae bacterium HGW-Ignavibacteriae-4]|nr:MAG: hypothetical protein CVV25_14815 [Ignavibacteriae bacterium HGW-Ignavibacteriae-4]
MLTYFADFQIFNLKFNELLISQQSSSSLIQKLKKEIDGNIENWSDLELELGRYTKKMHTTEEFNEVFDDIEDNLADYLDSVENNFDFKQFDGNELFKYLAYPENSLPIADKNKIKTFRNNWKNSQWNINLITFNYTQVWEKLTKYTGKSLQINDFVNRNNHPVVFAKMEHIHGYTHQRMVLGVNDVTQVSNIDFQINQDITETLIKDECNQAQKHTVDTWCKNQIQSANLICIFGSSIGDTDNLWWQLIGEQLKRECNLIIFEKGEIIPPRRPQKGKIAERNKKNYFLGKTNLNDTEKSVASEKIFIGINTEMFKLT